MAYAYAYGTIVNIDTFFTVFEAWITGTVGWTLESGSGTQDLVLSSEGETGDYAAFGESVYLRLYQGTGGNDRYIFGQAYSDVAGTEKTTTGTICRLDCNAAGDSFDYWMAGDKDAFIIVVKNLTSSLSNRIYLGTLIPYAKTKASWQYFTCAGLSTSAIVLRKYDGTYDHTETARNYQTVAMTAVNELDGTVTFFSEHLGSSGTLLGQFRHMTCRVQEAEISALDRIRTGPPGSQTEWIILNYNNNNSYIFALRTNDQIPSGEYHEANFQYLAGLATTRAGWFAVLETWLVNTVGWTVESGSGSEDIIYSSIGESGTDSIFMRLRTSATVLYGSVRDDLAGTHTSSEAIVNFASTYFPTRYYMAADKDCLCLTIIQSNGECEPMWLGVLEPFSRNLPSTPYKMAAYGEFNTTRYAYLLRKQQSAESWNYSMIIDNNADLDQPNVDLESYYVWPLYFHQTSPTTPLGVMKYLMKSSSKRQSTFDTIQTGNHIYKHFYQGTTFGYWAMRIQ